MVSQYLDLVAGRAEAVPATQAGGKQLSRSQRRTPNSADFLLHCDGNPRLLFTENETNNERIFGTPNPTPYVKDGINDYVVAGRQEAVNPNQTGTKAAAHYQLNVAPAIRGRSGFGSAMSHRRDPFGSQFEQIFEQRRREADKFYQAMTPAGVGEDAANVMRQALAGMLWSKQYFFFDVDKWLEEHGVDPMRPARARCGTANGFT